MVGSFIVGGENLNILFPDKTIKLWKVSERDRRAEGYNLKEDSGILRDPSSITSLRVPVLKPMELMVEASPRRIFANAHTYHINSISVNSDQVRGNRYLLSCSLSRELKLLKTNRSQESRGGVCFIKSLI